MIRVSATKFRNNLFDYLDKASDGESIVIQRNHQDVARIIPTYPINWREKMSMKPEILVSSEKLMEPIEGFWGETI